LRLGDLRLAQVLTSFTNRRRRQRAFTAHHAQCKFCPYQLNYSHGLLADMITTCTTGRPNEQSSRMNRKLSLIQLAIYGRPA